MILTKFTFIATMIAAIVHACLWLSAPYGSDSYRHHEIMVFLFLVWSDTLSIRIKLGAGEK